MSVSAWRGSLLQTCVLALTVALLSTLVEKAIFTMTAVDSIDGGVASAPDAALLLEDDPNVWLEEVHAEDALAWVKDRNANSLSELGDPTRTAMYDRILGILDSKDKIPHVSKINDYYYNFWQDENHVRGIWRRTTLDEYLKSEPQWETVIDVDQLGKDEDVSWVWGGSALLDEGEGVHKDRALIKLSRGGADATVVREFDLDRQEWVKDQPFTLPEAKNRISYKSRDLLLVGTDTGEGSLTTSGYPRLIKEWRRGTPLEDAVTVFEAQNDDIAATGYAYYDHGIHYEWRVRTITFYTSHQFLKIGDGDFIRIDVPDDMRVSAYADQLLFAPRTAWAYKGTEYPAGSLLSTRAGDFFAGSAELVSLFSPTPNSSLEDWTSTKTMLILTALDNVKSRLVFWKYTDGHWEQLPLQGDTTIASMSVRAIDSDESDDFWLTESGYTQPSCLFLCKGTDSKNKVKSLPDMYDTSNLEVTQHEATSLDGTKIPYFQVSRASMLMDGSNPTLLYGYGGFEISLTPSYAASVGVGWLEHGGVYVQANIRGGGEMGPSWHQAALKEKRHKAFEDFIAVADDLVQRGITRPDRLGIQGGSNGGLLMGNMLTMRPDLFGAIVCQVPLLDMKRYHKLLAGASWMAEYGDPDKESEWHFLRKYSPYHNIANGTIYPPILFTTSTRDDRVHPGHARKMVKKLSDQGAPSVFYYENIEGGHGGAADNKQRAFMSALAYRFLHKTLRVTAALAKP